MSDFEFFIHQLGALESFTKAEICLIGQKSRLVELKTSESLSKGAADSRWLAVLLSGVLGIYLCYPERDDRLRHFIQSPESFTNLQSCSPLCSTRYLFRALLDSRVLMLNLNSFRTNTDLYQKLEQLYRHTHEQNLSQRMLLQDILRCASPFEQYYRLLDSLPTLILQVPLKYIAEYLSISPQSLSRIRRSNN